MMSKDGLERKTFVKPSGVELEVNENSYSAAAALGWEPKAEKPAGPTVEQIAEAIGKVDMSVKDNVTEGGKAKKAAVEAILDATISKGDLAAAEKLVAAD